MRRSNIHAARPRRCACAASLTTQSALRQKCKTLNIHALTAALRVCASLNITQSVNAKWNGSNVHAARPGRCACSAQPEYPRVGSNAKKKMRRSNIHAAGPRGAARVQPSLNPRSRLFNAKKMRRSNIHVRPATLRVCSQPDPAVGPNAKKMGSTFMRPGPRHARSASSLNPAVGLNAKI
jgi:hypothetical protein